MGTNTAFATPQARLTSRLAVKPPGSADGFVDGAWWPRTRNLAAELPALLTALAGRFGYAERVMYNLTVWHPPGRRLLVNGRVVRLEGFRSQDTDTLTVIEAGGQRRLTILVVPPATEPAVAWHAMAVATEPGNVASPAALLSAMNRPPDADSPPKPCPRTNSLGTATAVSLTC
jgi:hypothetical protein